jgi:hypothetical protein
MTDMPLGCATTVLRSMTQSKGVGMTSERRDRPPVQVSQRQTITKARTYPYRCLFTGAVKVG